MDIETLSLMSLAELQSAYQAKELSPVEVLQTTFEQYERTRDSINALYGIRKAEALGEAVASEERYAEGKPLSAFDGVPVSIKDSVDAVGMRWHHGSKIHGDGILATRDAPPVKRLKRAGAIIIGKCAMPDFGLSASGVSGTHGIVRNPWGLKWNTGGSSAGAGASIAAGIGMMSVGSDIAGSVRLPASHCGLAALKPTQGVIPHSPASTVRSAGPITRKAVDLHAWAMLLCGPDDADRYSMAYDPINGNGTPIVGSTADFGFGPDVEPTVRTCFERARKALEEIVGEVRPVSKKAGFDAYLPIDRSLKIRGLREYTEAPPDLRCQAPEQLCNWFTEAQNWTLAEINEIEAGLERSVAFCVELFEDIDILLTPVMPVVNFPAEDRGIDPSMPLRHTTFTALFNQSGHPAVSICGGFDERGLPIGMQLVGKRHDDARVINIAAQLEAKLDLFGSGGEVWPTTPRG